MKKFTTFLSAIAILVGLFLTLEALNNASLTSAPNSTSTQGLAAPFKVVRQDIAQIITATSTAVPKKAAEIIIPAKTSGQITQLFIKKGDTVQAGSPILSISIRNNDNLDKAQAALRQAQDDLSRALAQQSFSGFTQNMLLSAQQNLENIKKQINADTKAAQQTILRLKRTLSSLDQKIQSLEAKNAIQLNNARTNAKNSLLRAYFILDKNIWLHNDIQEKYFFKNDQLSILVREKEASAFKEYYTIKWFMENYINQDQPKDWMISEAIQYTEKALQALSVAYLTTNSALEDPYYKAILSQADQDKIDEAREEINDAQILINQAKNDWKNAFDKNQLKALAQERKTAAQLLLAEENRFKQIQADGQKAVQAAEIALQQAYRKQASQQQQIAQKTSLINSLKAKLHYAQTLYQKAAATSQASIMVSKYPGTIAQIIAVPGQWIEKGEPIVRIQPNSKDFVIKLNILENKATQLNSSNPVSITSEDYPNTVWQGVIQNISSQNEIIEGNAFREVTIRFSPCTNELQAPICNSESFPVKVQISANIKKNALIVPLEYLTQKEGQYFVKTIRGGSLALQQVRIGIKNNHSAEILEDLNENDTIYLP